MIEINVQQGTPEWHAARAKYFTASEAPAMMGVSPYMTRSELLRQKATGITPEHDAATMRRFQDGHDAEARARPHVESMLGEELYPVVAADDSGMLLASSDGATMLYDTGFEHKLWNSEVAESVRAGIVPDHHAWQLDHQIAVFGFEKVIFVVSDGTPDRFVSCEYRTTPERQERLLAGWRQFKIDLASYEPQAAAPETAEGKAPETLPALHIEVTGQVTASNLAAFREHALSVIRGIKTELKTDQDFADADRTVKWCGEVESRLDGAKQHALSQTASIDELFRTIDTIKGEAREVRLKLEKLVKSEKESRKLQIVTQAQRDIAAHIAALNERIGGRFMPAFDDRVFGEATKGLKSLDSMRDKVSVALANAKIETSAMADRIETNRKTVEDMSLLPDFAQVCTKAPEDFAALQSMRSSARREAEEKRMAAERERIRQEEQAKAQREAEEKRMAAERERIRQEEQAKAQREAEEKRMAAERERIRQEEQAKAQREAEARASAERAAQQVVHPPVESVETVQAAPSVSAFVPPMAEPITDSAKRVTLGQINSILSPVRIDAAGLSKIGIEPVGRERAAVLYRESDVQRICQELMRHLRSVFDAQRKAA